LSQWLGGSALYTYVLLSEGVKAADLEEKFPHFLKKYMVVEFTAYFGKDVDINDVFQVKMRPLLNIHLRPSKFFEIGPQGNEDSVYIFSVIAFLGVVWAGRLYSGRQDQGNRYSQGIRCFIGRHYPIAFKRIFQMGGHCCYHWLARRLLCYEPLAPGFCLQNRYWYRQFYPCRDFSLCHCPINSRVPVRQNRQGQPGGQFKVRMNR
jgi:hypothetical protein